MGPDGVGVITFGLVDPGVEDENIADYAVVGVFREIDARLGGLFTRLDDQFGNILRARDTGIIGGVVCRFVGTDDGEIGVELFH